MGGAPYFLHKCRFLTEGHTEFRAHGAHRRDLQVPARMALSLEVIFADGRGCVRKGSCTERQNGSALPFF